MEESERKRQRKHSHCTYRNRNGQIESTESSVNHTLIHPLGRTDTHRTMERGKENENKNRFFSSFPFNSLLFVAHSNVVQIVTFHIGKSFYMSSCNWGRGTPKRRNIFDHFDVNYRMIHIVTNGMCCMEGIKRTKTDTSISSSSSGRWLKRRRRINSNKENFSQ